MAYWDFLQMTPENQAAARNTSWGSALKSEIPGTSNYRGYNPFYRGADKVGLGSYLNQGAKSLAGNFQAGSNVGGATTLMRKMAMSPVARGIGTVGRVAGLANPMGAAATAAWATPKLINKLTARDPGATKSSLFGIDLTPRKTTPVRQAGETPEKFESTADILREKITEAGGIDYAAVHQGEKEIQAMDPKQKNMLMKLTDKLTKDFVGEKGLTAKSVAKGVGKKFITNQIAKKVAGTSFLAGLGPIGWFIGSWLANKAVDKFTGTDTGLGITGVMDAFTGKLKAPGSQAQWEADKELRILEKRKDDMWNRMLENKPYSEKNLIDVINKTAKKKGYVDADDMAMINTITGEDFEHEGAISTTLPKELPFEHEGAISTTLPKELPFEHEGAISTTPPPKKTIAPVHAPSPYRGGNGGNGGSTPGDQSRDPTGGSPFYKGGRIDKALTGRSRDI